ncbi:hypothetical protein NDU88_003184 [Pleurodeles waltl]|uniref:Uncharacterized protein n=1 Tax=Pleurodeles waltl TaxID=8319 RepID=A0AAV7PCC6_PLEWA|nr:hypothetical protein NDU88_003184 [Pleurodeles waltl]
MRGVLCPLAGAGPCLFSPHGPEQRSPLSGRCGLSAFCRVRRACAAPEETNEERPMQAFSACLAEDGATFASPRGPEQVSPLWRVVGAGARACRSAVQSPEEVPAAQRAQGGACCTAASCCFVECHRSRSGGPGILRWISAADLEAEVGGAADAEGSCRSGERSPRGDLRSVGDVFGPLGIFGPLGRWPRSSLYRLLLGCPVTCVGYGPGSPFLSPDIAPRVSPVLKKNDPPIGPFALLLPPFLSVSA